MPRQQATSADDAQAILTGLDDALVAQFGDAKAAEDRLTQARFHLQTAAMAVAHLYEEADRRDAERQERIRRIEAGEEA